MPERDLPKITFPDAPKDAFGPERRAKTLASLATYEQARSEAMRALRIEVDEVVVGWMSRAPLRVIHLSDWHWGSDASGREHVARLDRELAVPGTVAMLYGDMIDGLIPDKPDTTTRVAYDYHAQITVFRETFLRRWVEQGKVLGLVGGYNGHEGTAKKILTIDAIRMMVEGLKQPDGSPVQIITQGGRLVIRQKNGQEYAFRVYHDPGGGGSDNLNPVGAQRSRDQEWTLDDPKGHKAVVAGHQHHRLGVSEEATQMADGIRVQTLVANGSLKDTTNEDSSDPFMRGQSKGPSKLGGAATVLIMRRGEIVPWTVLGADKGAMIDQAARVWDRAEQLGLTDSIIAKARKKEGDMRVRFDKSKSKSGLRNATGRSVAPLYETLVFAVNSHRMPMAVCVLANARYGSTSTNKEAIAQVVATAATRDGFYLLGGRHLVDTGVSRQENRMEILARMADDLAPAKDALLAFMLSKSFREDAWKKDLGEFQPGISTGDWLFRRSSIAGIPLYSNATRLEFRFNGRGPTYAGEGMDGLDQSGSSLDPFRGLVRAGQQTRTSLDFVTGGNARGVGVLDDGHTTYIAPGWFAKWDTRGKLNEVSLPLGGNGWIMYPDRKMLFGAPTFTELCDRHEALTLLASMEALGIKPEKLVARKTR